MNDEAKLDLAVNALFEGQSNDSRSPEWKQTILDICNHYAAFFNKPAWLIFETLEKNRSGWFPNYYQWSNFPKLNEVNIYKTKDDLLADIQPSIGFRCPSCGGVSKNHTECDSGSLVDNKVCDWKAYGFLGNLGKGFKVIIEDTFFDNPIIYDIFQPISKEKPIE